MHIIRFQILFWIQIHHHQSRDHW